MDGSERETWHIKVGLKPELLKGMPFGTLKSRYALGLIFSLAGFKEEMFLILQNTSHKTRAYLWNANGLRGFLVEDCSVLRIISEVLSKDRLDEKVKWPRIDFIEVRKLIRGF